MNIDTHIVIKEIGTLTYSEVSPIYKKSRNTLHLDEKGYCAYDILFNPPVEVKWKYSEISILEETSIVEKVELEYDFGMKDEFFPEQEIIESPGFWKYRDIDLTSPMIEIIKRYVEEQLMFSLLRNPCELKHKDWALKGWLRNRAVFPWHNEERKI